MVEEQTSPEMTNTIRSHFNHLVSELESSESQITPTVRAIYEGGFQAQFGECLTERIIQYDSDIEKMCNHHYQGFIDSVNELLKVQSMVNSLQSHICNVHSMLGINSSDLIESHEQLIASRTELKNIALTIEAIQACLPVLDLYDRLNEEMKNRNYYSAIKILGQLEHTYLPPVSNYSFASIMTQHIPKIREKIKEDSRSDLKDFLNDIREHSEDIGLNAMWQSYQMGSADIPSNILGKRPKDIEKGPQDVVNFSPVYRCLHIYSVIGERDAFETEYREDRTKQAELTFRFTNQDNNKDYFCKIVGFFVIEDALLHTSQGLVTRATVDELWELALNKLESHLTQSSQWEEPEQLLDLKLLIVMFCQTLGGYGFNVSRLYKLLVKLYQRYCDCLQTKWNQKFETIFYKDNYSPITVHSEKELKDLMRCTISQMKERDTMKFPLHLSFSKFVPDIFAHMEEYIEASLRFATHLDLSQTEVDDMVRRSTNDLLTKTLNQSLTDLIKKENLVLSQIVQISINTSYLQQYCPAMEQFISSKTGCTINNAKISKLYGLQTFKEVKEEAKRQIYVKLTHKIDEFFELSHYNWKTTVAREAPSDYMMDMLTYLKNTFKAFTQLEPVVAQTACIKACEHIADTLYDLFVDVGIQKMTKASVDSLDQDVVACEDFALGEPVKGMKQIELLMPFQPLRHLVDIIRHGDYDKYIADYTSSKGKMTQYPGVKPDILTRLLERLLDREAKKFSFSFNQNKNEKEMNKLLEVVIKKLRTLAVEESAGVVYKN